MGEFRAMRNAFRIVCLGLGAAFYCLHGAHAQGVVYVNSAGQRVRFDAAEAPDWARVDSVGAVHLKFNEVTFSVTYKDCTANRGRGNNQGFDDPQMGLGRRAAVERVLEYLGDVLNETAPATCEIVFDTSQTDGKGFLATAGPLFFASPHGFRNGFAFDHITTGLDPLEGSADIVCQVDFAFPWYTDADPAVPEDAYDLYSALLHEITHGIGLISLISADGDSVISEGNPGVYTRWDALLSTGRGRYLLREDTVFRAGVAALEGMNSGIVARGPVMQSTFGGLGVPVYAPSPYVAASSLSHLHESLPDPLLMHPILKPGVSIREYSEIEIAALRDIGYLKATTPGDPAGSFLSREFSIEETDGQAAIVIELSEPLGVGKAASLQFEALSGTAISPEDFARVVGMLSFGPFDQSKSFIVPIENDAWREPLETVVLQIKKPEGMTLPTSSRTAILSIVDNDSLPGVGFAGASLSMEEGNGCVRVTVALTDVPHDDEQASVRVVSLPGTATFADFSPIDEVVAFAPGTSEATFEVLLWEDSAYEGAESFTLRLLDVTDAIVQPASSEVVVTIADNDPDSDGDGISDADESSGVFGYVTDPDSDDTDGDLLTDGEEVFGSRGPQTNPLLRDTDSDGTPDGVEVYAGSDPTNPLEAESLSVTTVPRFTGKR